MDTPDDQPNARYAATYATTSGTTGTVPAPWHDRMVTAALTDNTAAFDEAMADATDALAADGVDVARFTVADWDAHPVPPDTPAADSGIAAVAVGDVPLDAPTTVLDVTQLVDATGSVDLGVQPDLAAPVPTLAPCRLVPLFYEIPEGDTPNE